MTHVMNKLLIIIGPTATGKTALAISAAKKLNGEIISADSRQVYRGLDIVTGKDKEEYGGVPVWGIDLVDPDYNFNVSDYVDYARAKTREIQNRGKLPIVVGGTVLYIKALLEPFETINVPPNEKLRKELYKLSVEELQKKLGENRMNESDFRNPRRLIRAIEIKESKQMPDQVRHDTFDTTIISLTAPLDYLYGRINKRVDERIQAGASEEYQKLLEKYSPTLPSMSAIGYKDQNAELWKLHEHQYAKRQVTFIKKFLKGKEVIELDIRDETAKDSLS